MSAPRNIFLTAESHNDARKQARRIYRGVYLRFLSVRRYCDNGYVLTYTSRPR